LERQDPAGRSEDSFEYNFQKFSLLEISPKTGRTHQIRVHLKYLSYPIVCDLLYNPKGLCPKRLSRLGLHAKSIEFTNLEGKRIKIESEIPPEFKRLLNSEY
jgi:23S rRNA-/tRNA-specific pseudouridylate synthase